MKKLKEMVARLTDRWPLLAFLVKLVQVFLDRRCG